MTTEAESKSYVTFVKVDASGAVQGTYQLRMSLDGVNQSVLKSVGSFNSLNAYLLNVQRQMAATESQLKSLDAKKKEGTILTEAHAEATAVLQSKYDLLQKELVKVVSGMMSEGEALQKNSQITRQAAQYYAGLRDSIATVTPKFDQITKSLMDQVPAYGQLRTGLQGYLDNIAQYKSFNATFKAEMKGTGDAALALKQRLEELKQAAGVGLKMGELRQLLIEQTYPLQTNPKSEKEYRAAILEQQKLIDVERKSIAEKIARAGDKTATKTVDGTEVKLTEADRQTLYREALAQQNRIDAVLQPILQDLTQREMVFNPKIIAKRASDRIKAPGFVQGLSDQELAKELENLKGLEAQFRVSDSTQRKGMAEHRELTGLLQNEINLREENRLKIKAEAEAEAEKLRIARIGQNVLEHHLNTVVGNGVEARAAVSVSQNNIPAVMKERLSPVSLSGMSTSELSRVQESLRAIQPLLVEIIGAQAEIVIRQHEQAILAEQTYRQRKEENKLIADAINAEMKKTQEQEKQEAIQARINAREREEANRKQAYTDIGQFQEYLSGHDQLYAAKQRLLELDKLIAAAQGKQNQAQIDFLASAPKMRKHLEEQVRYHERIAQDEDKLKRSRNSQMMLQASVINTVQSLGSGMPASMVLMQQAPQMLGAFVQEADWFAKFVNFLVSPMGLLGIAGAAATATVALKPMMDELSRNEIKAVMAPSTDFREEYAKKVREAARNVSANAPGSSGEFIDAGTTLYQDSTLRNFDLERLLRLSRDIAKSQKIEIPDAAKSLGKMLAEPVTAISSMRQQSYKNVSGEDVLHVEDLVRTGHLFEAQSVILEKLEGRLKGVGEAATGLGRAYDSTLTAMSNFANAVGGTDVALETRLKQIKERKDYLTQLPVGPWRGPGGPALELKRLNQEEQQLLTRRQQMAAEQKQVEPTVVSQQYDHEPRLLERLHEQTKVLQDYNDALERGTRQTAEFKITQEATSQILHEYNKEYKDLSDPKLQQMVSNRFNELWLQYVEKGTTAINEQNIQLANQEKLLAVNVEHLKSATRVREEAIERERVKQEVEQNPLLQGNTPEERKGLVDRIVNLFVDSRKADLKRSSLQYVEQLQSQNAGIFYPPGASRAARVEQSRIDLMVRNGQLDETYADQVSEELATQRLNQLTDQTDQIRLQLYGYNQLIAAKRQLNSVPSGGDFSTVFKPGKEIDPTQQLPPFEGTPDFPRVTHELNLNTLDQEFGYSADFMKFLEARKGLLTTYDLATIKLQAFADTSQSVDFENIGQFRDKMEQLMKATIDAGIALKEFGAIDANKGLQDNIDLLKLEISLQGESTEAIRRRLAVERYSQSLVGLPDKERENRIKKFTEGYDLRVQADNPKFFDAMGTAMKDFGEEAGKIGKNVANTWTDVVSGMEDALTSFATTGKLSFSGMANSIIADIIRMQIRATITGPLSSAGGELMKGLGGSLSGLFDGIFGGGGDFYTTTVKKHRGGAVDGSGQRLLVPQAVFHNAPRYHSGNMPWLRADEEATILQRGEVVLPRGMSVSNTKNHAGSGNYIYVDATGATNPEEFERAAVRAMFAFQPMLVKDAANFAQAKILQRYRNNGNRLK